jgi:hypothetical protein
MYIYIYIYIYMDRHVASTLRRCFTAQCVKTHGCTTVIYVFSGPTDRSVCVPIEPPHTSRERSSTQNMMTSIDWAWKRDRCIPVVM